MRALALAGVVVTALGTAPRASEAFVGRKLPVRPLFVLTGYSPERPFQQPTDLALDARHRILYVADPGERQIVAFSRQGVPAFVVGAGPAFEPVSLAVNGGGELVVADRGANSIRVFDASGKPESELKLADLGAREPLRIGRIALDRNDKLYVVDRANCEVLVFDQSRQLQARFGTRGEGEGRFKAPEDIAVDRFGRIYVSDSLAAPVQVFDPAGKYLYQIGRHGEGPDDLLRPAGLHLDRFDQLWLVDTNRHTIGVYDRFGMLLRQFGEFGQTEGKFFYPVAVAVDGLGCIYVLEQQGRRLQVLAFDDPLERFTP